MGKNTRKDQRTGKMGEAAVVLKLMVHWQKNII